MLKSTDKGVSNKKREQDMFDMYHTCQWCHYSYYKDGVCYCTNTNYVEGSVVPFSYKFQEVSESGRVHEVIEESLEGEDYKRFADRLVTSAMLELRLSGSNSQRLRKLFFDFGAEFIRDVSEKTDINLVTAMNKEVEDEPLVEIGNPESFYCNYWE